MKYLSISIVKENSQNDADKSNNDYSSQKRSGCSNESRLKTPSSCNGTKEKIGKFIESRKKAEMSKQSLNSNKQKTRKEEVKDSKLNVHSFKTKQLIHKMSNSQNTGRDSNIKNRPGTTSTKFD